MKYCMLFLLLISTASTMAYSPSNCTPVTPDVKTQGFWRHVSRGTHPSGEHERIPSYLSCIRSVQTFSNVRTTADVDRELNPNPASNKMKQARSQFMAVMLNLCSGRVAECNCLNDSAIGATTVGEAIRFIDAILSKANPSRDELVLAQAIADRINNGTSLTNCRPPRPTECADDSYDTDWDAPLVVGAPGVLANDVPGDGGSLTATLTSSTSYGHLTFNADGSFTYVPAPYQLVTDSFTYTVTDGISCCTATVTIRVLGGTPPQEAPVCQDDSYSTDWDTELVIDAASGLLSNDSDPNGDALAAYIADAPAHGTVSINADGSFVYTPEPYWAGQVSFVYSVCDAYECSLCTVTIDIAAGTPPNVAPVCSADSYTTPWSQVLTVAAPGVLINDSDANGDTLTALLESGPARGSLTLNADGSFSYTAPQGFVGQVSFVYRVFDGQLSSNCVATINVTASSTAPNLPPVCQDDYYTTNWDTKLVVPAPGILGNDYDPNANTMTAHLHSAPSIGTLILGQDGGFTYQPVAGQSGVVSFVYRAWDGRVYSLCTVYIDVTVGNLPPVCGPESYTVKAGTRLTVPAPGVIANDYDPEGAPLTVFGTSIVPEVGKLGLNADGSFWYDAPAGYTGTVSFVYKVGDGIAKTSCTVYITVVP